jgi:hypothetical protein
MSQTSHSECKGKPARLPNNFKLVVEPPEASFEREFTTIKTMTQFLRRNPGIQAKRYVFHNNKWETFAVYGSQVLPKSVLKNLLKSITN